jgi:hypothetical protein
MRAWLKRRWWLLLLLLPVLAVLGFVGWASIVPAPMPQALEAMQSGDQVLVETGPWLVFRPADQEPSTGLIIYPGGRVDPRAYAPAARAIAAQGHLVVIVPMLLNLPILTPDKATEVIAAFPDIERWAIAGHSLGGAMAARFAHRHPDAVQGLALWAAYPAAGDDLSTQGISVVSISGTRDGLATPEEIDASRPLLPPDTRWVAIDGGNHAQFGWYGPQDGDGEASISREEQQAPIVQATLDLLNTLE